MFHSVQDAVLRAKSDHERLASKGIDFLIDLEMGELPPKEFILRNMEPAEEPEDNVTSTGGDLVGGEVGGGV